MKKNLYFISGMLFILFTAVPYKSSAQLLIAGPNNPGAMTEESAGCLSCPGSEWINHPNAILPDSLFATTVYSGYPNCFMTNCYYARGLMAKNLGFSIPAGAAIQGIRVDVLRNANLPNAIHDTLVQLLRGGVPSGGNRGAPAFPYPMSAAYTTYGDSADLWDTVWSTAEINSTDFGFFFKPLNKTSGQAQAGVDHIQVTVYYMGPTGILLHQTSSGSLYYDASSQLLFLPGPVNKTGAAVLAVYDANGKMVLEKTFSAQPPASVKINLPHNGIYIAGFSDGNSMQKIKFHTPAE
jgi:hypothetical protein